MHYLHIRLCATLTLLILSGRISIAQTGSVGISLNVDATSAPGKILHVLESLSVQQGDLTLYYPQWIPGEHGPTGPIVDLVGLKISAGTKTVLWRRDLNDMFAFHCTVPSGMTSLDLAFDFILPPTAEGFSSGASSTSQLLVLSWNQVVLYPKTAKPENITVTPRLRLPEGWKFGTALETEGESEGAIRFKPVSLPKLVDSPVLSGHFFKRLDISDGLKTSHFLNMVSDGDEALHMPEPMVVEFHHLVGEANALFGAHHYDHYDFLLTLSDNTAHFGLEHHQSSDNRTSERSLLDNDLRVTFAGLLPHEFVHSWNGKYRRPSGLATGDYSTPMQGDLLWVYEGLTQYLGNVLTARSGLRTPEEYREHLALTAAVLDHRPGRQWRPLQETADAAQILYGARHDWDSYRRDVDYYDEGNLIWLEVDATVRQESKGKKSLDDFCKLFYGGESTPPLMKPYTFDDIVAALNQVVHFDWASLLGERLQSIAPHAPLNGIVQSGWRLAYRDTLSGLMRSYEQRDKRIDMRFSLGIYLQEDGEMMDVIPGMAAAKAGIAPGMKLIAVNGRRFTKDVLREAVRSARGGNMPIDLLVENVDYFKMYSVDYHGGEQYPFLERDASKAHLLSSIIKPVIVKK